MSNIATISNIESNIKLADELQAIADEIRTRNEHAVFRAIIVLEGKGTIESKSLGANIRTFEALGLLEFAKLTAAIEGGGA